MAQAQWFLIYTLRGRSPVQYGPFLTEAQCLQVKAALMPYASGEGTFVHWRGPDTQ